METLPIIIDTDPGVDDALALAFAYKAGLPVAALTTVYGNNSVENTTRNAGYIAKTFDTDWHIYEGASKPLKDEGYLSRAHGVSGLGDVIPTDDQITPAEPESAAAFYRGIAGDEGKYTLFCLGPLTNIAEALSSNPSLPEKIGKMVIMGGAFRKAGANRSPYAEYNMFNDPHAAEVTFRKAYEKKIDTTVIPGEVCNDVVLTPDDLNNLKQQHLMPNLHAIVGPYLDYYMRPGSEGSHKGAPLYDVLVPLYYQHPEIFTTDVRRIQVAQKLPRKGKTVAIPDANSKIQICRSVDVDEARRLVLEILGGSSKGVA